MKSSAKKNWRELAGMLAASIPLEQLHPAVVNWAGGRPAPERWGVAFSGGPDSLALLLLVWAHWPKRRRRLVAFHFDHRLRGRTSAGDAVFCKRVCAALGVAFVGGNWPGRHAGVGEGEARKARFGFFEKGMSSRRMKALWFGHQRDDIAESMLMRLARGSGAAGLAAPRPVHRLAAGRVHLRPLLTLDKSGIESTLRRLAIPWRRDASNSGGSFFRNRVRRSVIPAWRLAAADRDAAAGAALSRELLDEDDEALEWWLREVAPLSSSGTLLLRRLQGRPRALLRRALHRWLEAVGCPTKLSRQGFTSLLDAIERGKPTRQSLGSGGFAEILDYRLKFRPLDR